MKRLLVLLMLMLLAAGAATAETWTIDTVYNPIYTVETFEGALPDLWREALADTPFAGDPVLQGVSMTQRYKDNGELFDSRLLAALEHDGTLLLVGGCRESGSAVQVWPASETFLRMGETFALTAVPGHDREGRVITASLAVEYGGRVFTVACRDGYTVLYTCRDMTAEGTGSVVSVTYPDYAYTLRTYERGECTSERTWSVCLPARLDVLTAADFPRTAEDLARWEAAYPLTESGWYARGANLREEPTGKSASMGVVRVALAEKLDQQPGREFPWYQLRIGDTVGWMSGAYVTHGIELAPPPAVLRCDREVALRVAMGGDTKQLLPAGTALQVVGDCGAWYHVVLPAGEIGWKLDADGTYGYVQASEVTEFATLLHLRLDSK